MQSVSWMTFGISNALTRSTVHFYPSSGSVTAPYPAVCRLSLFGGGHVRHTVTVEGVRLSQPDGIRIEEAFPILKEGSSGLYGLEVELSTSQPRVDIGESVCIIELSSKVQSTRFWAARQQEAQPGASQRLTALAIKDCFTSTSLVVVNAGSGPVQPEVHTSLTDAAGFELSEALFSEVGAEAVQEFDLQTALGGRFFEDIMAQECSWGLVRTRNLIYSPLVVPQAACFVLYRDASTRRPVSVSRL